MIKLIGVKPTVDNIRIKINQLIKASVKNTGSLTLTANQTTTTISDQNIYSGSKIYLTPLTLNAANETWYILAANITDGQFIITHANAVSADRDFNYIYLD